MRDAQQPGLVSHRRDSQRPYIYHAYRLASGYVYLSLQANVGDFVRAQAGDQRLQLVQVDVTLEGTPAGRIMCLFDDEIPRSWWVVAPYLVGATATAITIGKSGSSVNYLFEFCAALSLVAGAWIAWSKEWPLLQALLIFTLVPQVVGIARWTREGRFNWVMGKIADIDAIERLAELAREADGPVLADEYVALVPLAGKPLYYHPFELKQLYLAEIWDERGLLQDIQDQKSPLLFIYDTPWWDSQTARWTPQQLIYISQYYEATERLAETLVYRPKTLSSND